MQKHTNCRTQRVHPEKNFYIFSAHTAISELSDCKSGMVYNEQLQTYIRLQNRNTTVATFCSSIRHFFLTSRKFYSIFYNVMLSAIAELQEKRGVLWVLAISDFGNFLLTKT